MRGEGNEQRRRDDGPGPGHSVWAVFVPLAIVAVSASIALPTPGDFDTSFGTGGVARLSFGSGMSGSAGRAVLQQSDGKLVVGGEGWNGKDGAFALVRYHPDGSLDTSFGDRGRVLTTIGSTTGTDEPGVHGLVQQADGKIVAVGRAANNGYGEALTLTRYNIDGSLDATFGANGVVRTSVSDYDFAWALAIQDDGKLVVGGWTVASRAPFDGFVARYHSDGSLDATFGSGGIVFINLGGKEEVVDLAIQPDGKIVATGYSALGGVGRLLLARFNEDGSPDTSFGSGGMVLTEETFWAHALVRQTDGKLVLAGSMSTGTKLDLALVRYSTDGSLDLSFGVGGRSTMAVGSSDDVALDVVQDATGGLIVAGRTRSGSCTRMVAARFLGDGAVDSSFGNGGSTVVERDGCAGDAQTLVLQNDGRIVLAGYDTDVGGYQWRFAVARLDASGAPDVSFGDGGFVLTNASSSDDVIADILLESDGKIIAVGYSRGDGDEDFAMARFDPNGALDPTFGSNGRVVTQVGAGNDRAVGVVRQSDGKLVLGGSAEHATGRDFCLARYDANGNPDPSFGTNGKVITSVGPSYSTVVSLVQQVDGKLVLGGSSLHNGATTLTLVRYLPDGQIDLDFGSGGTVWVTGVGGPRELIIQNDGKFVAVANSAIRLDTYGVPEPGFPVGGLYGGPFNTVLQQPDQKLLVAGASLLRLKTTGQVESQFPSTARQIEYHAVGLQADGKILAGGIDIGPAPLGQLSLARYQANGTVDTSFGPAGWTTKVLSPQASQAVALRVQPDTRVVVAAKNEGDFTLVRLLSQDCGDGQPDAGEECDDANVVSDDGCDANCTVTACGNGIVTSGEQCDDDNLIDGDGCASNCTVQATYTPTVTATRTPTGTRTATRTPTTTRSATPSPTATVAPPTHSPTESPTAGPTSTASATPQPTATCSQTPTQTETPSPTTTWTESPTSTSSPTATETPNPATPTPASLCPTSPRLDCRLASGGSILVRRGATAARHRLQWVWRYGSPLPNEDLGDPENGSAFAVCVYDTHGAVPALAVAIEMRAGDCDGRPCWQRRAGNRLSYRDPGGESGLAARMSIAAGTSQRARLRFRAIGSALLLPASGGSVLAQEPSVIAQVLNERGLCWQSVFGQPASSTTADYFRDRLPE